MWKFSCGKNQTIQNVESASSPYISDAIPVGFSPLYTHSTCACTVRVQRSKLANYYAWGYRKNQFAPRNTFLCFWCQDSVLFLSRFFLFALRFVSFCFENVSWIVCVTRKCNSVVRVSKLKIFPLINRENKLCYFTNGRQACILIIIFEYLLNILMLILLRSVVKFKIFVSLNLSNC